MINSFRLTDSKIAPDVPTPPLVPTTNGSKVLLVWNTSASWDSSPPTVPTPENLKAIVSYPRPGQSNGTVEIFCKSAEVLVVPGQRVEVLCQFDGDIHGFHAAEGRIGDTVTFETPDAPNHWLTNGTHHGERLTAQNTTGIANNSKVLYPQPVVSWDMAPHQVLPIGLFIHIDLAAYHRYSYPDSPFGDLKVEMNFSRPLHMPNWVQAVPIGKVSERLGFPSYHIYRASFPAGPIPDGDDWNIQFRITPSRGDVGSKLFSTTYSNDNTWNPNEPEAEGVVQPNVEELRVAKNFSGTALGATWYTVVNPAAANSSDTLRNPYATKALARQNPFKTIGGALASLSLMAAEGLSNGFILLAAGNHRWGPAPSQDLSAAKRWLTIQADEEDGHLRDEVFITNLGFTLKFNIPAQNALKITNTSPSRLFNWRWTSLQLTITEVSTLGEELFIANIPRNQTLAQIATQIDGLFGGGVLNGEVLNDHDAWIASRDYRHFPGTSDDEAIQPDNGFVRIRGNHSSSLSISATQMQISIGDQETGNLVAKTYDFSQAQWDTVQDLVNAIVADYGPGSTNQYLTASQVIEGSGEFPSTSLKVQSTPGLPDQQIVGLGFAKDAGGAGMTAGIKHKFVKLRRVTVRSTPLLSSNFLAPSHLWLDDIKVIEETKASVPFVEIVATSTEWAGGVWSTRCDWEKVNVCTKGWVMVRDAYFKTIGADCGKEISYACNWKLEDVFQVPGDVKHADIYQWSPPSNMANNNQLHENILAVNLDCRDNVDAQPFLFNLPGFNSVTPHRYKRIALISWRSNAAKVHQFSGNVDHFLLWFVTMLQGVKGGFSIFASGLNGNATAHFYNLSIRNGVFDRVKLEGRGSTGLTGDMPSLWSLLDNCHIFDELQDEVGPVTITSYPACTTGSTAQMLIENFPNGEWVPADPAGPPTLRDRVAQGQVTAPYDALGVEREVGETDPPGSIGAIWVAG